MTMVRVEDRVRLALRSIAREEGRPMGEVLQDAVERYRREKFWEGVRDDYARLEADPAAWASYREEAELWDTGAGDGLEDEQPWPMSHGQSG